MRKTADKFVVGKLKELMNNPNTRMRYSGPNTWELTINVDDKGVAIYKSQTLEAAAPDLLEACKIMLAEHYRVNEQLNQPKTSLTTGMKAAAEAIAKAEVNKKAV